VLQWSVFRFAHYYVGDARCSGLANRVADSADTFDLQFPSEQAHDAYLSLCSTSLVELTGVATQAMLQLIGMYTLSRRQSLLMVFSATGSAIVGNLGGFEQPEVYAQTMHLSFLFILWLPCMLIVAHDRDACLSHRYGEGSVCYTDDVRTVGQCSGDYSCTLPVLGMGTGCGTSLGGQYMDEAPYNANLADAWMLEDDLCTMYDLGDVESWDAMLFHQNPSNRLAGDVDRNAEHQAVGQKRARSPYHSTRCPTSSGRPRAHCGPTTVDDVMRNSSSMNHDLERAIVVNQPLMQQNDTTPGTAHLLNQLAMKQKEQGDKNAVETAMLVQQLMMKQIELGESFDDWLQEVADCSVNQCPVEDYANCSSADSSAPSSEFSSAPSPEFSSALSSEFSSAPSSEFSSALPSHSEVACLHPDPRQSSQDAIISAQAVELPFDFSGNKPTFEFSETPNRGKNDFSGSKPSLDFSKDATCRNRNDFSGSTPSFDILGCTPNGNLARQMNASTPPHQSGLSNSSTFSKEQHGFTFFDEYASVANFVFVAVQGEDLGF